MIRSDPIAHPIHRRQALGVSNFEIAQMQELVDLGTPPAVNQIEYHIGYHDDMLVECNDLGTADRSEPASLTRLRWPRRHFRDLRTCSADHWPSATTHRRAVGLTHSCFLRPPSLPRSLADGKNNSIVMQA